MEWVMILMFLLGLASSAFIGYKIGVWKGIRSQFVGTIYTRIEQDNGTILEGFMKEIK